MKFAIYLPARNAGAALAKTIARIPESVRQAAQEILVVDNASQDNTEEILEELRASYPNLSFIRHETDRGYGGSQKSAYAHCLSRNYDAVVMLHADGQYAPELCGALVERLFSSSATMVFGSRMTGDPLAGGMPLYRFGANVVLTGLANHFLRTSLSEFHSGYRAYRLKDLEAVGFDQLTDDYHFDTEIIAALVEKKLTIEEMPVPTHYGADSQSIGFFHSVWYGMNVIKVAVKFWVKRSRYSCQNS